MNKKRGIFFTIDAILAAGIFLAIIFLVSSTYVSAPDKAQVSFISQDIIRIFTNLKVSEFDNVYVKNLINTGVITRANNTILEQIGEFWAENKIELAENFTRAITDSLVPERFGFGIYVDGEEIYLRSKSITRNLISSRKIISGIEKEKPTEGFTSKAILNGIKSKTTSAYSYFGGFEGEGNLTKKLILPGDVTNIVNATLELESGGNFDLYINNAFSGSYVKGSAGGGYMRTDKFTIDNGYYGNFLNGTNVFTINLTSGDKYVAGGFLKVRYETSEVNDTTQNYGQTFWIPGIDGIINYYSSILVPGDLNSMQIHLDFFSNYETYFRVGNTTVYSDFATGDTTIDISNSTLSNIFLSEGISYSDLSLKTIPIRFGLNLTEIIQQGNSDVILITDVSGSMNWRLDSTSDGITRNCNDPNLYSPSTKRISLARCLDRQFIDVVLNTSQGNTTNRIGLVSYSGIPNSIPTASSTIIMSTHDLSADNVSLKNEIDSYTPNGATGVCGAIRQARTMLEAQSSPSRRKFIIAMTDGLANVQCDPGNEYETVGCIARTCTSSNNYCFGGTQEGCLEQQCGDWVSTTASNNAIDDACRAFNTTGATVFSIGFGPVGNCPLGNQTLVNIASCGNGSSYMSTNATELSNIYNQIAQKILKASQVTQAINISGDLNTSAYPTSYIQLNYTPRSNFIFGKIPLSFETERFGNNITTGTLTIPGNITVFEAKVTSYSSYTWTDGLTVNGNIVFDLTDFGLNYIILGDPFIVNIPTENLIEGVNNLIISTGVSPTNKTGGSAEDKAIYTLLMNGFSDYSPVVAKSEGCDWTVKFEDNSTDIITIPKTYSGGDSCNYENAIYEQDDAVDIAVYNLFKNIDLDKNGLLDIKINEENFNIEALTITKVPSLWGPAIVEIRVWE